MKLARPNNKPGNIVYNMFLAAFALFINGFGIYLTIRANIGASPWDVFNLGLSRTFGILYGNASIAVSFTILVIDILMREPIGIAMFIDAVVVGKSVDFFNWLGLMPDCQSLVTSVPVMFIGLFIIAYTQYLYMIAALGCGPRDSLLVGLKKRLKKIPIGAISIVLFASVTLIGWLLGGKVGIGTVICAFCSGPIMQFAFESMHFDATTIVHQKLQESARVFRGDAL